MLRVIFNMNFNKWRTAIILLLAVGILLCQSKSSDAVPNSDPVIQGIWRLNFSPPYMVPSMLGNAESYFHLKLSSPNNGDFTGRAIWNFGNTQNDSAKRVSASIAGQIDQDKNVSINLFEPGGRPNGGVILLLKGRSDGPDIKGSVDNTMLLHLVWSELKWLWKMPSSGNFTLRRIKPEEEKQVETLFSNPAN
jgi:hypothetical protein